MAKKTQKHKFVKQTRGSLIASRLRRDPVARARNTATRYLHRRSRFRLPNEILENIGRMGTMGAYNNFARAIGHTIHRSRSNLQRAAVERGVRSTLRRRNNNRFGSIYNNPLRYMRVRGRWVRRL